MKEEKLLILSMLEEGKITSEEAVKLIEALEGLNTPNDEKRKESQDSQKEQGFGNMFNSLEDIGSDISNALSNMFGGLKDIGGSFGFKNNYETISEDLNLDISNIENPSLDLRAINGSINLIPSNSDELSIKVLCQHKKGLLNENESYFDFYIDNDVIKFSPKYNSGISINLDVFLPENKYNNVLLNSTNGKIDVTKLSINFLECNTSNASINVSYLDSKDIVLSTKNGKIESQYINSDSFKGYTTNSSVLLSFINSNDLYVKTANGKIDINSINSENILCKTSNGSIVAKVLASNIIELTTSNGRITCDDIDTNKAEIVKLITSNASINSKIEKIHKESSFDLETSMGNINIEIPDLIYKTNKQVNLGLKKIVAHTVDFNSSTENTEFIISTSNSSIQII